jgi:hypothetical protein
VRGMSIAELKASRKTLLFSRLSPSLSFDVRGVTAPMWNLLHSTNRTTHGIGNN